MIVDIILFLAHSIHHASSEAVLQSRENKCGQHQDALLIGRYRNLRRTLPGEALSQKHLPRRDPTILSGQFCLVSLFLLSLDHHYFRSSGQQPVEGWLDLQFH
ncbi:hypothetical protein Dimus_031795 [Dionaea muscipula]